LIFSRPDLDTGHLYLPTRRYAYPNTALNFELASAVAEGVYKRIKTEPAYAATRPAILYHSLCAGLVAPDFARLKIFGGNDFALSRQAAPGNNDADFWWNQGSTTLRELVAFLVMDDLLRVDTKLRAILRKVEARRVELRDAWWGILGEDRREFVWHLDVAL